MDVHGHLTKFESGYSPTIRKRKQIDLTNDDASEDLGKPCRDTKKRKTSGSAKIANNTKRQEIPKSSRIEEMYLPSEGIPMIDLTGDDDGEVIACPVSKKKPKKTDKSIGDEEKRQKRFRKAPPQSYYSYYERAMTQRLFALNRSRTTSSDCPRSHQSCPTETVDLAGSTGNVYNVTITHVPRCTCPNFTKGNSQCKHILYVLIKVLKAPEHLRYQLAFLSSELHEIFDNAGPLPVETVDDSDKDGRRKPVEGDCPICCCDLVDEGEEVVWCKAACGNNLHKTCFEQWKSSKKGAQVPCPYCRTPWQSDEGSLRDVATKGRVGEDGYVNVAQELGLSGARDYSSYHSYWVRRQARNGLIESEAEGWDF